MEVNEESKPAYQVHDAVTIEHTSTSSISLEWNANPVSDMLADSVLALVLQLESNPRNFKSMWRFFCLYLTSF